LLVWKKQEFTWDPLKRNLKLVFLQGSKSKYRDISCEDQYYERQNKNIV